MSRQDFGLGEENENAGAKSKMTITVAIDGPAGAGKSTVAKQAAAALGYTYIDTGAMYRVVAWKAIQTGVAPDDADALTAIARAMTLFLSSLDADGAQTVSVDSVDVTNAIRAPEVSALTSTISALPALRRVLVERQRQLGREAERGVVLDGRDIGTVVFPNADVKIFLTASAEERARRRCEELRERGLPADFDQVLREQIERDTRDSQREDSPLAIAANATVLNTDGLTAGQVAERIIALCRAKMPEATE